MATLALLQKLRSHASDRPNDVAYREASGGRSLTWRALVDQIDAFAHTLQSNLPARGVVMLCAANQIEYPIAFLGILSAGFDVFPLSTEMADAELLRAVEQSAAVAIVGHARACATLEGRAMAIDIDSWALIGNRKPFDDRPHPNLLPGGEGTGSRSPSDGFQNPTSGRHLTPSPGTPDFGQLSRAAEGWGEGLPRGASDSSKQNKLPPSDHSPTDSSRLADRMNLPLAAGSHLKPLAGHRTRGREDAEQLIETEPALLLQSSGTTGLPKIVRRSGRSIDAVSAAMAEAVGFSPADHVLATVPLTHSYGLEHGLLAPMWAGSTVHLCRGLDVPTVLGELSREHITIFPAVPAVFEMLAGVSDAPHIASLRTAYSAGAPLPDSVIDRFAGRFGVRVTQLYGATEIGSVTFNSPTDQPFDRASVGKPMNGVSIRILNVTTQALVPSGEEGQVAVRAESMFDGYLEETQPPTEVGGPHHPNSDSITGLPTSVGSARNLIDGYFPTGDLGHIDASGRLFITGRLKLLIDVGGMKVNPFEVEAVLAAHPQVGECVVVAIRQSETVSRIKAVISPRDPNSPPAVEELRAFAKARLSAYKVPRVFEIRSALPRSATGKVLRHAIESEG